MIQISKPIVWESVVRHSSRLCCLNFHFKIIQCFQEPKDVRDIICLFFALYHRPPKYHHHIHFVAFYITEIDQKFIVKITVIFQNLHRNIHLKQSCIDFWQQAHPKPSILHIRCIICFLLITLTFHHFHNMFSPFHKHYRFPTSSFTHYVNLVNGRK